MRIIKKKKILILIAILFILALYSYSQGLIKLILFDDQNENLIFTNYRDYELIEYSINSYHKNEYEKCNAIGLYLANNSSNSDRNLALGNYSIGLAYYGIENYERSLEALLDSVELIENDRDKILESEYYLLIASNYVSLERYGSSYSNEITFWMTKGIETRLLDEELNVFEIDSLSSMYYQLMYTYYHQKDFENLDRVLDEADEKIGKSSVGYYYESLMLIAREQDINDLANELLSIDGKLAPQIIYSLIEISLYQSEYDKTVYYLDLLKNSYEGEMVEMFYYNYYYGRYFYEVGEEENTAQYYEAALNLNYRFLNLEPMRSALSEVEVNIEKYEQLLYEEQKNNSKRVFGSLK